MASQPSIPRYVPIRIRERAARSRPGVIVVLAFWIGPGLLAAVHPPPTRGPLPDDQREIIHHLAAAHDAIARTVTLTPVGYEATTTSQDPEMAAMLKAHVSYMKARMEAGLMIRRWAPAFVEMVEHQNDIRVEVTELDNGIFVRVEGDTPAAILVAQNHAKIVSGFARDGATAVHRSHSVALPTEAGTLRPEVDRSTLDRPRPGRRPGGNR
jgi:hypothetical protein